MPVTNYNSPQVSNKLVFREDWTESCLPSSREIDLSVSPTSDRTLVLETTPIAGNSQTIDTFGRGFYGPEYDSGGRGDRWTNGRGNAYFYTRIDTTELAIDFYSPFPDGTRLEMVLSRQVEAGRNNFTNEMHVEFWGKCNDVCRLAIPLKLQPRTLYRLTIISPVYSSSHSKDAANSLGIAVVSAALQGTPLALVGGAPALIGAEETKSARIPLDPAPRLERVEKILITGDTMRPYPDGTLHQRTNIQWLWRLLQYPVMRAVGNVPVGQLGCVADGTPVSTQIYDQAGYTPCESDWVRLSSRTSLEPACLETLDRTYHGSMVIGFEMSDMMLRYFQHRGIPYIDAMLHPARYLDDVFLAFRTNVPQAFESLRTYAVPDEQLHVQAGIHAGTIVRMKPVAMEPNSCLLLGQTKVDKSLICGERVLSLDDFGDELRQLARDHSRVYFKRHPYHLEDPAIIAELQREGLLHITEANTYGLFCNEHIAKVVAISSGALYEAQFFGKQTQYLHHPSYRLGNELSPFDPWTYIGVYDAFYTPRFWADLLAPTCPVDNCPEVIIPPKTSRLRTSLQSYWGYNFLDHDILQNNLQGKVITEA